VRAASRPLKRSVTYHDKSCQIHVPVAKSFITGSKSMANQRMIAKAVGVTQAAVSLALRGDPSIPPATRERILECAKKLGYRPNSYVSALMAHVRSGRALQDKGCIALLVDAASMKEWHVVETFKLQYQGIVNRAEELGVRTEVFFLRAPGMSAARTDHILYSRGITGLILMPSPTGPHAIEMTWSRYAMGTIAYGWNTLHVDRVATHHRHNVHAVFRQLESRGYKRIGVCLPPEAVTGVDLNWQAGFLLEKKLNKSLATVPQFVGKPGLTPISKFRNWLNRYKPDAIVSLIGHELEWLRELGLSAPEDVGLACVNRPTNSKLSGIEENHQVIGAAITDLVVAQVTRNEFGFPPYPKLILIEGTWVEGETLRPPQ
jgi:Transcriptional regulators